MIYEPILSMSAPVFNREIENNRLIAGGYAVALLSGNLPSSSRYRLSLGSLVGLKDVVKLYREATGHAVNAIWGGRPYRPREAVEPRSPAPVLLDWVLSKSPATWLGESAARTTT